MKQMNTTGNDLKRTLKNRHLQLIALGGTIGTGLFLGSSGVIAMTGPGIILGYLIGGFFAFLIMRYLGEMLVEEPVAGSFSHFAYKYCGEFMGYLSGWNSVILYVLVGMLELTAAGKFIQYWRPDIPIWVSSALILIIINLINLISVKAYGESEFWFSLIKVLSVCAMIIFGTYLIWTGSKENPAILTNLWSHDGIFPHGWKGFITAFPFIMYAFGGMEMMGFAAAEASNPERIIPKVINQVIWRVLLFYVGSFIVILTLIPWDSLASMMMKGGDPYANSPFVLIFSVAGHFNYIADILNFVILSAVVSVYNGTVFSLSRLLYSMSSQGNAPSSLNKVNNRGVPKNAIILSASVTAFSVLINFIIPKNAFEILITAVTATLLINWVIIITSHLGFKRSQGLRGGVSKFKSILSPASNYTCLFFIGLIMVVMTYSNTERGSVYAIPAIIFIIYISYKRKLMKERLAVK